MWGALLKAGTILLTAIGVKDAVDSAVVERNEAQMDAAEANWGKWVLFGLAGVVVYNLLRK